MDTVKILAKCFSTSPVNAAVETGKEATGIWIFSLQLTF